MPIRHPSRPTRSARSRFLAPVLAASTLLGACAAPGDTLDDDEALAALDAALVQEGTPQAAALLAVANAQPLPGLLEQVGLDRRAATSIVARRPFATLAALDAAPYIGPRAIELLLEYAVAQGQVAPGGDEVVFGVEENTRDGFTVLKMANHLPLATLGAIGLPQPVAEAIVARRPHGSLRALAGVAGVSQDVFDRLLGHAIANRLESTWPPAFDVGEAPLVVVPGADVPSALVDAARAYAGRRHIATLAGIGALDATARAVAERADGVLGSHPADGYLDLIELVTLERPEFSGLLYPDEKARLPGLFQRLEVPVGARVDLRFPELAPLTMENLTVTPGGLTFPSALPIPSIALALRASASRLQLVFDSDANAGTITIDDLDATWDNPDPFTFQELDDFDAIRPLFHERAVSNGAARIRVTAPGTTVELRQVGAVTLTRTVSIEHRESRFIDQNSSGWNGNFFSNRDVSYVLGSTSPGTMVLVNEANGAERTLPLQPSSAAEAAPGNYVLEHWANGVRIGASRVLISGWAGAQLPESRLPLVDHFDVVVETHAGQPLFRNVTLARASRPSGIWNYEAEYRYELSARAPSGVSDGSALTLAATPAAPLPPGRYHFNVTNLGVVSLDVYPSGAVRTGAGGAAGIPLRFSSFSGAKTLQGSLGVPGYSIRFFPATADVRVYFNNSEVFARALTFADRVL